MVDRRGTGEKEKKEEREQVGEKGCWLTGKKKGRLRV